ncbi:MAG: Hsp33 family molecular chaperone HslO [Gammaproteobacteria bacterium]|nr:Hsp33 family molecular chaperone HslO [Gammaproteobacteria bacterium]
MKDLLNRFLFDKYPVRGEVVHLDDAWKAVLDKHDYPELVRNMLGEAMAATALLSATIKFLGSITLQIQGDGPVSMLVVQVTTDKKIRAMATYESSELQPGLKNLFGEARLMITIEMENAAERYQGIVELGDRNIAASLEEYFKSSEQLETRLWLTANGEVAAGFLLQQMPKESMPNASDGWNRFCVLAETLKDDELISLEAEELLHRLYHEDDIRLFTPDRIEFSCSCSSDRIEKTLKNMGYEEVKSILAEQGKVEVDCNFCNHHYEYDAIDVEKIFIDGLAVAPSNTRH